MVSKVDKAIQQLLEMNLDTKGSKAEIDLLWENASPASAFANQTIRLDLSRYGMAMVICNPGTGMAGRVLPAVFCQIPGSGVATGTQAISGTVYGRFFKAYPDHVQFDDCNATGMVIPRYIYGVKI